MSATITEVKRWQLTPDDLDRLFTALQRDGYQVIGPRVQDGAVVLDRLTEFAELARGYRDSQAPGHYRVEAAEDTAFFRYAVGPHSLKRFLHPPRRRLWRAEQTGAGQDFTVIEEPVETPPLALFGIRSCDLEAMKVLDRVFTAGPGVEPTYRQVREQLFLVSATCTDPSAVCFCSSMGHGPHPEDSFDINLTESWRPDSHLFVAQAGSSRGDRLLKAVNPTPVSAEGVRRSQEAITGAWQGVTKRLDEPNIPSLLKNNPEHPRWDDVATRCLSCANCTMVCPTCFCSTIEDVTDLSGTNSERWLSWDSCFTSDFSFVHGGSVRKSTKSRYRQWLTHKLATWHDQFQSSGCVGCGRCIAWCPVGIDLTEEVKAIGAKDEGH
jgi:ferredoxin